MKKIVRLTESDLTRIVKRVINERSLLTESVIDTTLVAKSSIEVPARRICGAGADYITVSVDVTNNGSADAYINRFPLVSRFQSPESSIKPLVQSGQYNVIVNGKPSIGYADDQKQFIIKKGTTAKINVVIKTNMDVANREKYKTTEGAQNYKNFVADIAKVASGKMVVKYNGADLEIPIKFGGFTVDPSMKCDAPVMLPKGF
jgi:hypothetical protein